MAFKLDLVGELDRAAISRSVRDRFSAVRMTDAYEEIYRKALEGPGDAEAGDEPLLPASAGTGPSGGDTGRSAAAQPRPIRPLQASTVR